MYTDKRKRGGLRRLWWMSTVALLLGVGLGALLFNPRAVGLDRNPHEQAALMATATAHQQQAATRQAAQATTAAASGSSAVSAAFHATATAVAIEALQYVQYVTATAAANEVAREAPPGP
jgi:hypothetical protein